MSSNKKNESSSAAAGDVVVQQAFKVASHRIMHGEIPDDTRQLLMREFKMGVDEADTVVASVCTYVRKRFVANIRRTFITGFSMTILSGLALFFSKDYIQETGKLPIFLFSLGMGVVLLIKGFRDRRRL